MSDGPPTAGRWLNLLVSSLVAFYVSYTWRVDAPPETPESAQQSWFLADHSYKWSLLIAAALLAGAAVALIARQQGGLLMGAAGEALFAITLAVMCVDTLLETGLQVGVFLIIMVVVMLLAASQARELWRAYKAVRATPSPTRPHLSE